MNVRMKPSTATQRPAAIGRKLAMAGLMGLLLVAALSPPPSEAKSPKPKLAPAASAGRATAAFALAEGSSAQTEGSTATRTRVVTFRQLGALAPLELRGVDGRTSVPFNIRDDEVVTSARLRLVFSYSPALLPQISHLNVRVNDEVVATLPLPREQAGTTLQRTIAINPVLLGEFNRLTLQLIGHYTLECEDPVHTSLWANVSNVSELELGLEPVNLSNDLRSLPSPFFDLKDPGAVKLPFVLAGRSPAQLEAAGAVSAWFGALSSYRGASFPVSASLPERGHAVVLALPGTKVAGLNLPSIAGPTLAMVSHPLDPQAKLLLVMGRSEAELKVAASALALGGNALSGASAVVSALDPTPLRKPFDAPRWIASDRPVKLGELAQGVELSARGYSDMSVRVPVSFPPGLSGWRGATAPLDLKYRHTPRVTRDKSVLNVNLDKNHLKAYSLSTETSTLGKLRETFKDTTGLGDMMSVHERLDLPVYLMPALGELNFHFSYDIHKEGPCKDVILDNQRGAIDPDSTIDLSGLHHFAAMPDLASFANQGFPFTRMADLSETVVVLGAQPKDPEVSTYLALMARFAAATGLPGVRVAVSTGGDAAVLEGRDLLVIGSAAELPMLKQWESSLPIALSAQGRRLNIADPWNRFNSWLLGDPERPGDPALSRLSLSGDSADAYLMGFESPINRGRSVVAVVASQPDAFANMVDALVSSELVSRIHGSVVSVRQAQVDSLSDSVDYHVGSLGLIDGLRWYIARHPLLLVLLLALGAFTLAVPLYVLLRRRAQRRLEGGH